MNWQIKWLRRYAAEQENRARAMTRHLHQSADNFVTVIMECEDFIEKLVALATLASVYICGYVRGETAATAQADTAGTVGRRVPSAPQSLHNEIALSGDCGGQGTARPTGAATDCNGEEAAR